MYGCPVHALRRALWDAQKDDVPCLANRSTLYVCVFWVWWDEEILFCRLTKVAKAGERLGQGSEIVDD